MSLLVKPELSLIEAFGCNLTGTLRDMSHSWRQRNRIKIEARSCSQESHEMHERDRSIQHEAASSYCCGMGVCSSGFCCPHSRYSTLRKSLLVLDLSNNNLHRVEGLLQNAKTLLSRNKGDLQLADGVLTQAGRHCCV